MSGAITEAEYFLLMRRYQRYTVALLPCCPVALLTIEQLTGTVRVPAVTISTQGSAEAGRSILEMREQLAVTEKQIDELEAEKETADKERQKEIETAVAQLEKDKAALEAGIESNRGLVASGSSTATVHTSGVPSPPSGNNLSSVTEAVKEITLRVLDTDDFHALCLASGKEDERFSSVCLASFDADIKRKEQFNSYFAMLLEEATTAKPGSPERRTALEQIDAGAGKYPRGVTMQSFREGRLTEEEVLNTVNKALADRQQEESSAKTRPKKD